MTQHTLRAGDMELVVDAQRGGSIMAFRKGRFDLMRPWDGNGDDPRPGLETAVDEFLHVGPALSPNADAAEEHGIARGRRGKGRRRNAHRGRP